MRLLGKSHRDALRSMSNIAIVYWDQAEAIDLHKNTLVGRIRFLGKDHPDTLRQ